MRSLDIYLPIRSENSNSFPSDINFNNFIIGSLEDAPLSLSIQNLVDDRSLQTIFEECSSNLNTAVRVNLRISRGLNQKFFSVFIGVLII